MFARLLQGSLRSRFTRLIGLPAALFLAAVLALVTVRTVLRAMDAAEAEALNMARIHAANLDRELAEAARVPHMHARMLESGMVRDEDTLRRYLTDVLVQTPGIYGTGLAFEPESFIPGQRNYCAYAYRKNGVPEFALLTPPGYDHFNWDWYQRPKRLDHAVWTEPYFDEGGGNIVMTTRAVPFRKPGADGKPGAFWGVATIDMSLEQLLMGLESLRVAQTGYALLLSPEGRILACPDKTKIMRSLLSDLNPSLAAALMPGSEGFVEGIDPLRNRKVWVAHTPVPNANFILALVYPAEEVFHDAKMLLIELLAIGLAGVALLFGALSHVARSVSRPVTKLALAARKIADGDMDQQLDERSNIQEVRELTSSFEKMTRDLRLRMEELRYTTALKQRMEGELNAARRIQMSMLPREWRDRAGWTGQAKLALHAIIQPAREVGGDFYDYRFLDEHRLSLLIGDVSGKGVPAALFMAMTQTLFQAHASAERTVPEVMARVNDALCAEAQTGMFVTLIYAVLDARQGTLEVCNSGHPPPYRMAAGAPPAPLLSARNPALGLLERFTFTTAIFPITPGDRLFFFTDGVTEAMNAANELFTVQRLEETLARLRDTDVESLTKAVIAEVQNHSRSRDASDDITVLAVDYSGPGDENDAGKPP